MLAVLQVSQCEIVWISARHVERWGYKRYWLAEHHNMKGIASAATSVLIGFIAGGVILLFESARAG